MIKILKPKNPNPNITTYNHMPLKNLFMNAVSLKIVKEKVFKLI